MRVGLAFLALREDAHVLLRKRAEAGLLGGMLEVPSTDWGDTLPPVKEALRTAPVRARMVGGAGQVAHTFTHFKPGDAGLPRALCRRILAPPSGPTRALPMGPPPRPRPRRPPQRDAQDHRPRPERELGATKPRCRALARRRCLVAGSTEAAGESVDSAVALDRDPAKPYRAPYARPISRTPQQ